MLLQIAAFEPKPDHRDHQAIVGTMLADAPGTVCRVFRYYENLVVLARLRGRTKIRPGNGVVARALGISRRSVIRAKQWLEANGLLRTAERHRANARDGKTRLSDWIELVRRPSLMARLASRLRSGLAQRCDKQRCDKPKGVTALFEAASGRQRCDNAVTAETRTRNKISEAEIEATKQTPEFKARMAELRACRAESGRLEHREGPAWGRSLYSLGGSVS